jgi:hypothetical protein
MMRLLQDSINVEVGVQDSINVEVGAYSGAQK